MIWTSISLTWSQKQLQYPVSYILSSDVLAKEYIRVDDMLLAKNYGGIFLLIGI